MCKLRCIKEYIQNANDRALGSRDKEEKQMKKEIE